MDENFHPISSLHTTREMLHVLMVLAVDKTVYVAPSGDDTHMGASWAPVLTLERARSLAATTRAGKVVLEPGTYTVTETLQLGAQDSGTRWLAPSGAASISGGQPITGWIPSSVAPGAVSASVAHIVGAQTRHLFTSGARAQRTRMPESVAAELFSGARMTDLGFELAGKVTPPWPLGGKGVEFVYPQSTSPWTEPRCAVASANASFVSMEQPCWKNLVHKACGQGARGPPALRGYAVAGLGAPLAGRGYVENVGPTANMGPGEWALLNGTVHYVLRPGESAATLVAVMPTVTTLLNVSAAVGVTFEGITFEHATWLRPGEADGYVEQQSGQCTVGSDPR